VNIIPQWFKRLFVGKQIDAPSDTLRLNTFSETQQKNGPETNANFVAYEWEEHYLKWLLHTTLPKTPSQISDDLSRKYTDILLHQLRDLGQKRFISDDLIPRVPAILPQLFRSLRDENASSKELAETIGKDVVLVAQVLHEVNSAYYSPAEKINSLENAVLLLGQNGLRMVLAKVSFRPIIQDQSGYLTRQLANIIWQQSEACAYAARYLAEEKGEDPFAAFLAGLLDNVGLIVSLRIADRIHAANFLPDDTHLRFDLLHYARQISVRIGEFWEFPENVIAAIEDQNSDIAIGRCSKMGRILRAADEISLIWVLLERNALGIDDERIKGSLSASSHRCLLKLKRKDKD